MFQKILNFIKFHNAFTISLVLIFVFGASVFASETIRESTIGKTIIEQKGIDNTVLLSANLDNLDFGMKITNVSEDKENYYVNYTYQTLDIKDNIWQEARRIETLTVSKSALSNRDLGLYITEELGEATDSELAYLKQVQQKQKQNGKTFIQETTKYTGLIGLVFNSAIKELPGYEIVVKPPKRQPIVYNEPVASESGSPEDSCVPDWSCLVWKPDALEVSAGQEFTQIRECIDLNSCESEEDRPLEIQIAVGARQAEDNSGGSGGEGCDVHTYYYDGDGDGYGHYGSFQSSCTQPEGYVLDNRDCDDSNASVNPGAEEICDDRIDNNCDNKIDMADDSCKAEATSTEATSTEPVCDSENLDLCDTQELCEGVSLYWYDGSCNLESEIVEPICSAERLDLCGSETECQAVSGYWYDDACNAEEETPACVVDWQCGDWTPLLETIACGEIFTQTRTCADANECGADEEKPSESQEAIGSDCASCGTTSCDAGLNLTGECQNTCVDGICQDCTPSCNCIEGYQKDDNGVCQLIDE
ncbi:MAG: putative metal-binding motif-containing protein [Patescibacteria group bacterium]|nr:putative metal-binding motif-containing protein [Patescibacteria group bacterium]